MFKEKRIKIVSAALVLSAIVSLISPVNLKALDFGSNIGTSAGLGSPLLNEASWETDDWNPWELVTF
jgi:hypothetical protein